MPTVTWIDGRVVWPNMLPHRPRDYSWYSNRSFAEFFDELISAIRDRLADERDLVRFNIPPASTPDNLVGHDGDRDPASVVVVT